MAKSEYGIRSVARARRTAFLLVLVICIVVQNRSDNNRSMTLVGILVPVSRADEIHTENADVDYTENADEIHTENADGLILYSYSYDH